MKIQNIELNFLKYKKFTDRIISILGILIITTSLFSLFLENILIFQVFLFIIFILSFVFITFLSTFFLISARLNRINKKIIFAKKQKKYAKVLGIFPWIFLFFIVNNFYFKELDFLLGKILLSLGLLVICPIMGYYLSRNIASIFRNVFKLNILN